MKLVTTVINQIDDQDKNRFDSTKKTNKLKSLIVDMLLLILVASIGFTHIYYLVNSQLFSTGYSDWLIQAFRVRFISEFGLSSWTHLWSNGISLWRGYQFLPHILTSEITKIFQIEITRAMVILTVIQFIGMRFIIYALARSQKFSAITGLVAVILSYDIGQYWGGVNDYSILFGFTIFPLYLAIWIQYTKGRMQWVLPYILGIAFYIHPLLAVYSAGLWFTGLLFKSLSRPRPKILFAQLAIFVASSSLFWVQHISGYVKNYSSPFFISLAFFKQTLANFSALGLSIAVLIGGGVLWVTLPTISQSARWTRAIALYSLICLVGVLISINVQLPGIIAETQFSRGMTFIALAIIVGLMPIIEKIKQSPSSTLKYLFVACISLSMVESFWISGSFAPHSGLPIEDPVVALQKKYPEMNIQNSRIWTPYLDVANNKATLNEKYPNSYMTHSDSNQVSVRLSNLLLYNSFQDRVPNVSLDRVKQYMQITATPYVIFEKNSPFVRSISVDDSDIKDLGDIELKRNIFHAYKLLNVSQSAIIIDPTQIQKLVKFPESLNPADPLDQTSLDQYVSEWVNMVYDPKNQPVTIQYSAQDTLDISIPKQRLSNTVYIPESYSKNWQGWFNGQKVDITPVGPNFIRVDMHQSGSYGLLILKHNWPTIWYISLATILLLPALYIVLKTTHLVISTK